MTHTLIRQVRILDPVRQLDLIGDIAISEGRISHCGDAVDPADFDDVVDGHGLWLLPPITDLAARFREPGATHKASFASEGPAALASGIADVVIPPDTSPVIDNPATVARLRRISERAAPLRVHLLGALTQQLDGRALSEMSALRQSGCVGVSQAQRPLSDPLLARQALEYARGLDLCVHVQVQDERLANHGCAHDCALSTRLGLPPIPVAAEVAALRMWISLAEDTGGRLHFQRISSARGAELVASAQQRGLQISADVAAHQLILTVDALSGFDAMAHVQPPLRSSDDRDQLRIAVASGVIGAICSDHQPHEPDAKVNPFPMTEPGISALHTLLPLTLELVAAGVLTPLAAAARLSQGPRAIAGLEQRSLAVGAPADLLLVDAGECWRASAEHWLSQGRNSPFYDSTLRGRVKQLWIDGRRVLAGS